MVFKEWPMPYWVSPLRYSGLSQSDLHKPRVRPVICASTELHPRGWVSMPAYSTTLAQAERRDARIIYLHSARYFRQ